MCTPEFKETKMFDKQKKLEISPDELQVIEDALQTQSKILHIQANAGGTGASRRLNDVKRVLSHISQQKPRDAKPRCRSRLGWFGSSRVQN